MVVETRPQGQDPAPQTSDSTAFILSAIDRLAADTRSNFESVRSDIRQLYYLNILTLLTALGALIAGLFALLVG